MINYLIDGNNLIWKIPELAKLQKDELTRFAAREKLIHRLERHFAGKKISVTVFFDGAPHGNFGGGIKTKYSYEKEADDLIRAAIEKLKTKHTTTVVSSDRKVFDYAKINGCKAMTSEEFSRLLEIEQTKRNNEEIPEELQNQDWLKIFTSGKNE